MDNPFRFSGVVEEPAFCNRKREKEEMGRYIESSQNVLLYSHRRYGKSSLILKVFKGLKNITPVYIDLYGTTRIEEFITSLLKGLIAIESHMNSLIKIIREGIRSIIIHFSVDPISGLPNVLPVFNRAAEDTTVDELFALLENLSQKKKMVVAFDEFQEITSYGGDTFEKRLRNLIQRHDRISYVFVGSKRHLITEMFNDRKRGLYMLATKYPLGKIETIHYLAWVKGLYRKARREIEDTFIADVVKRCENHPMYIQEFLFNLWPEEVLSFEHLDKVERNLLEKRIPEYSLLWDSLTLNQRRALKLIAGTRGINIFAAKNLDRFGFRTASQVTAALGNLEKVGILDKNKGWKIHDPFFTRWLLLP